MKISTKKQKETMERCFASVKDKHGMRYTQYRGLAQVSKRVRLKFVAMNLKKTGNMEGKVSDFQDVYYNFCPVFAILDQNNEEPVATLS